MFDFLKKGKGDLPPDVGKEESADSEQEPAESSGAESSAENAEIEKLQTELKKSSKAASATAAVGSSAGSGVSSVQFERLNAKMDALEALMRGYSERFSSVSEQIGEVRSMSLLTEKELAKSRQESAMAVDIVKEVKPQSLRVDYQKADMKISALSEKLDANKQFSESVMTEIKDLRRKAGIFVGTEALLKLNEEVKKDLIEIQKVDSRVRVYADKTEQIFIELKRGIAESQKAGEMVDNLDNVVAGLKKEFEKTSIDLSNVIKESDLDAFKKTLNKKLTAYENYFREMDRIKRENEKLANLIETTVSIAKQNKTDIGDVAMSIGDDNVKRVSDYDIRLASILGIVDTLAGQISEIKKSLGISTEKKIVVEPDSHKRIQKGKIMMKNVTVEKNEPAIEEGKIADFKKNLNELQKKKLELISYLEDLKNKYAQKKIPYSAYAHTIYEKKNGKTIHGWLDYYNKSIDYYEKTLKAGVKNKHRFPQGIPPGTRTSEEVTSEG